MQVESTKPKFKLPVSKTLKLEHDKLLSNVAFEFNWRRYFVVVRGRKRAGSFTRGLHSFTLELNLSNSRTPS